LFLFCRSNSFFYRILEELYHYLEVREDF